MSNCKDCKHSHSICYTTYPPSYGTKCSLGLNTQATDCDKYEIDFSKAIVADDTCTITVANKPGIVDSLIGILKDKQYVDDSGIWSPMPGYKNCSELVISKEAFIEAYNRWIKND